MIRKSLDYICLALFLAGFIAMFMPSEPSPPDLRTTEQIWNFGHAALFFLAAHLAYTFYPRLSASTVSRQALLITAAVLLAGTVTELAQSLLPGRFPSLYDITANLAGALAYMSLKNRSQIKKHPIIHLSVACLIILILLPPIRAISDEIIAYRQFPLLADFETPFEKTRFTGTATHEITSDRSYRGSRSLKINLDTTTYSGISMQYMPRTWQNYSTLCFAVYNPNPAPISLTVRIHDTKHETQPVQQHSDRFNRSFKLSPQTWTTIEIPLQEVRTAPLARDLNLNQIQSLGMFVTRASEPWTIYLDYIRLK
ncbi:MAG: VanZ family protein [Bacteroidota bacterium]